MKSRFFLFLLLPVSLLVLSGCDKPSGEDTEDDPDDIVLPVAKDYPYEITSTITIENIDVLLEDKGLSDYSETVHEYLGSNADKPVLAINYTYPSVGPLGEDVTLSARLYILKSLYGYAKPILGMVLANHASIVEAGQCPTCDLKEEGAAAWAGVAVVMPDYYGFGASGDKPQAYLNSDCAAKGNIDAFKTARKILHDKGVIDSRDYYNGGYSQGGFNTIANLRYLANHPEENLSFKCSFAGAGSYDIPASLEEYLKGGFPAASVFIPLTVIATNECEGLGLDYSKLFREPLLSNYDEWILSKEYSFGTIMKNIGTYNLAEILTEDAFNGSGEEIKTLHGYLEEYSLTSGWEDAPDGDILLYHSTEDDVVPSFNSDMLYEYLKGMGADVKLVKGEDGGHTDAEVAFVMAIGSEIL